MTLTTPLKPSPSEEPEGRGEMVKKKKQLDVDYVALSSCRKVA